LQVCITPSACVREIARLGRSARKLYSQFRPRTGQNVPPFQATGRPRTKSSGHRGAESPERARPDRVEHNGDLGGSGDVYSHGDLRRLFIILTVGHVDLG
jgi:hypothetical protein